MAVAGCQVGQSVLHMRCAVFYISVLRIWREVLGGLSALVHMAPHLVPYDALPEKHFFYHLCHAVRPNARCASVGFSPTSHLWLPF